MADEDAGEAFREVSEHLPDVQIGQAHGIAAIALNLALKYHDMSTVQDGTMYQQMKLEGKNFKTLGLNDVLETAKLMELHIMAAPGRISDLIQEAVIAAVDELVEEEETDESATRQEGDTTG